MLRLVLFILCSAVLLGGCNFVPEPATLIKAPQYAEASDDLLIKTKELLPAGTIYAAASQPVGGDPFFQVDLDGDGNNEMVILYQSIGKQEQPGALILKKVKDEWEEVTEIKGTGYEISWASSADITGDGKQELLLGWKIGASAGNVLDIFTWDSQKGGLEKLTQLNYHEMEILYPENKKDSQARIAIWQREMADVYSTELVRWDPGTGFQQDYSFYPAYFSKVAEYYEARAQAVPNASYYWYYLAEARLKEGHPEQALQAIQRGMNLKATIPSSAEFEKLKREIEERLHQEGETVNYYVKEADFTLAVPKSLAANLILKSEAGSNNQFIVNVYSALENENLSFLFTVEVYQKDWIETIEDYGLSRLFETDTLIYGIRKHENDHSQTAKDMTNKIISSIRPGAYFEKLKSLEEQNLLKMVQTAEKNYWYITSGGKMEDGLIESFTFNDMDYRYMGSDLDTKEKVVDLLSSTFTSKAIHQYMEMAGIVEHNGKLAQPNADGGSIADFKRASVFLTKDLGPEKEFDLKVPLGDGLVTETVHIVFRNTDKGWRIDSLPGSF
ncbi:hypothetical protein F7731_05475 [Cytobacillus depressus]|uniref:Uncharacterized protein n=1 Tax=Cytobacillus depressus TaxID=1602942 RepID=A0A6L3V6K0_9BACI|nr:DL-endopeptidase inhibitor IseA family protein [Cytobacillus depressus]KAB2337077.1 hypothetical protein F7731_05475 [Cytobacillus depressus]